MLHLQKICLFGTATIIKTHRINNDITARHIALKNSWFCFFDQHLPPKKLWILFNKIYVPYNVPNTHYNSSCNKQALIQLHWKLEIKLQDVQNSYMLLMTRYLHMHKIIKTKETKKLFDPDGMNICMMMQGVIRCATVPSHRFRNEKITHFYMWHKRANLPY